MLPVEFEDVLPEWWTPIGKLGVQYRVSDICMEYTKDDPYPTWDGTVHLRCGTLYRYYEIRGEPWTVWNIQHALWDHIYMFEQNAERRMAQKFFGGLLG